MMVVAAIGIGTLMWQQRRQHAHRDSVQGFNQALKAISPEASPGPFRQADRAARRPATRRRTPGRPVPLDARQRAQARRRLEERRRIEARRRAHAARAASGYDA